MTAEESLRAGRLDEALSLLQDQVRRQPAHVEHRIFLFQLQAVLGQWTRALNQLQVLADQGARLASLVETYAPAIRCELLRAEVFAGRRSPLLFGEPEPWSALMLKAAQLEAAGQADQAEPLRAQALDLAPATGGTINGERFSWIADSDSRLGPLLEVIVGGRYYWLPVSRLRAARLEKPADLRDLVWTPAFLTLSNGGELAALIPTRYPGSEASDQAAIRLAKRTEWSERRPGTFFGLGQRVLATDQGEYSLMDVRELDLGVEGASADAGEGQSGPPSPARL